MSERALDVKLIHSESGLRIVTEPFLVGDELQEQSKLCSYDYAKTLNMNQLNQPIVVLNILRGGKYYFMQESLQQYVNECKQDISIELAEIQAQRYQKDDGSWDVKIWYPFPENKPDELIQSAGTIVIGDTIATGATLDGILRWLLKVRENRSINVNIFSIAGGDVALRRLATLPSELKLNITYANYVFSLAPNGTDLGFLTAKAEASGQSKKYVDNLLGDFIKHMKCAVWDWSDRFVEIPEHLKMVKEYFDTIDSTPKFIENGLIQNINKYKQ